MSAPADRELIDDGPDPEAAAFDAWLAARADAHDAETEAALTEMFAAVVFAVIDRREPVCPDCDGYGTVRRFPRNAVDQVPCETCDGTGYVRMERL